MDSFTDKRKDAAAHCDHRLAHAVGAGAQNEDPLTKRVAKAALDQIPCRRDDDLDLLAICSQFALVCAFTGATVLRIWQDRGVAALA